MTRSHKRHHTGAKEVTHKEAVATARKIVRHLLLWPMQPGRFGFNFESVFQMDPYWAQELVEGRVSTAEALRLTLDDVFTSVQRSWFVKPQRMLNYFIGVIIYALLDLEEVQRGVAIHTDLAQQVADEKMTAIEAFLESSSRSDVPKETFPSRKDSEHRFDQTLKDLDEALEN